MSRQQPSSSSDVPDQQDEEHRADASQGVPQPTPGRRADLQDILNDDWPPTDPRGVDFNFYNHPARTAVSARQIWDAVGHLPRWGAAQPTSNAERLLPAHRAFVLATETAARAAADAHHRLRASATEPMAQIMQDMSPAESAHPSWRSPGPLPSFSRAFDMFMPTEDDEGSNAESDDKFFVPTYLESSTYIQKLRDAHRARVQARKEAKRSSSLNKSSSAVNLRSAAALPSGSHRGMSHTVVERTAEPTQEDDGLFPLPTQWNRDDMAIAIDAQPDGLGIKFPESKAHHERELEACAARTDHHIPPQCGIYYYEVQILAGKRDDTFIAVGFSTKTASIDRPVGWEPESWGYHCDDGRCFTGQKIGRPFAPTFSAGDVIGCGINFKERSAFYTKNGASLGFAFHDIPKGKLYPSVSLKKPGEHIIANFGQTPFVFNIDDMVREQQARIQKQIMATDTSTLEHGMSETDLIHDLVMQFLQHDGYVETARAFAEDLKIENEALSSASGSKAKDIVLHDDHDANNRQNIRRAILEGDIDRALDYVQAHYPTVLQNNAQVTFKLRCRKFIEMVRKASAHRNAETNGNGMDLDVNGTNGSSSGHNGLQDQQLQELEMSTLQYGQDLQREYASDTRKEVKATLKDIWSLLAYANPLAEPQVAHLLDRKGRQAVAEELNSAILESLGKSSRAALETLYAQTSVLLEDLRTEGGDGAFVSMEDVLEGVSRAEASQ